MIRRHLAGSLAVLLLLAFPVAAQQADSSLLTLTRVYGSGEFATQKFGPSRWLGDGSAYTTLEPTAGSRPSFSIVMGMATPIEAARMRFSVIAATITSPSATSL